MKKLFYFGVMLLGLLLPSCAIYQAPMATLPLISEKNEVQLDVGLSLIPSVNASVAWGITNHLAVNAAGHIAPTNYSAQLALGYYKNLSNKWVMEAYGGFLYGGGQEFYGANRGEERQGVNRQVFGQFNIGQKDLGKGAIFDYAFGLKLGYNNARIWGLTVLDYSDYENTILIPFVYNNHKLVVEPYAQFRVGGQRVKFIMKLAGSSLLPFYYFGNEISWTYLNFSLGIHFTF